MSYMEDNGCEFIKVALTWDLNIKIINGNDEW